MVFIFGVFRKGRFKTVDECSSRKRKSKERSTNVCCITPWQAIQLSIWKMCDCWSKALETASITVLGSKSGDFIVIPNIALLFIFHVSIPLYIHGLFWCRDNLYCNICRGGFKVQWLSNIWYTKLNF